MRGAHVRHVGVIVGQADHQLGRLPEILAELAQIIEQDFQALAIGMASYGSSRLVGWPARQALRQAMTV